MKKILSLFLFLFSLVIGFCSKNYEDIISLLKFPSDIKIEDEFIIF